MRHISRSQLRRSLTNYVAESSVAEVSPLGNYGTPRLVNARCVSNYVAEFRTRSVNLVRDDYVASAVLGA